MEATMRHGHDFLAKPIDKGPLPLPQPTLLHSYTMFGRSVTPPFPQYDNCELLPAWGIKGAPRRARSTASEPINIPFHLSTRCGTLLTTSMSHCTTYHLHRMAMQLYQAVILLAVRHGCRQ